MRPEWTPQALLADTADAVESHACSEAGTVAEILGELGCPGNFTGANFCNWTGVDCEGCHVVGIRCRTATGRLTHRLKELTQLCKLFLNSTQVTGDVAVFSSTPKLQVLNLGSTRVTGDVAVFQSTPKLQALTLCSTQVSGDVAVFTATPQLQRLCLTSTHVTGDVAVFEATQKLQYLYLTSTQVIGDVAVFKATPRLLELFLTSTQVTGNVDVCNATPQLVGLGLGATQVTGDLAVFKATPELQHLYLTSTQVTGNVAVFNATKHLRQLRLASTQVTGDVAVFTFTPNLQQLRLASTQVTGNVAVFAATPMLQWLALDYTQVAGDLAVFKATTQLQYLHLTSTRVTGDVAVFKDTPKLEILDLDSTRITGDVAVFEATPHLQQLLLGSTRVSGSISVIPSLNFAIEVNFANTTVFGRISSMWRGGSRSLQRLRLSDTSVSLLPEGDSSEELQAIRTDEDRALLPALASLDVSRSPVHGDVKDLVQLLLACKSLTFLAAAGCGLTGSLSFLQRELLRVDDSLQLGYATGLSASLQTLDLSGNQLQAVLDLPPSLVAIDLSKHQSLALPDQALSRLLWKHVQVNLAGTSLETSEPEELLHSGKLQVTSTWPVVTESHACQDLIDSTLRVSPHLFAPDILCGCAAGWHGHGTSCSECQAGTFNPERNHNECQACPENSTSKVGSQTLEDCQCNAGLPYNHSGRLVCACQNGEALVRGSCASCSELHLNCTGRGNIGSTAPPAPGYARLHANAEQVFQCPAPAQVRCPGFTSSNLTTGWLGCQRGYAGPLCMACAHGFRSDGRRCKVCKQARQDHMAFFCGAVGLGGILGGAFYWRRSRAVSAQAEEKGAQAARKALLAAQAPMLLQMVQLWVVLSSLGKKEELDSDGASDFDANFWEVSYLQAAQLTVEGLKDSFNLQCVLDPSMVRFASAIAAPLVPLFLLSCCAVLEMCFLGTGVRLALKTLTVLFIGGASSAMSLLECQDLDGGGLSLGPDAFRRLFPDVLCEGDKTWVDWLGYATVFAYSVVIPLFLLYIMALQHVALQESRLLIPHATVDAKRTLHLEWLRKTQPPKETARPRLLAAAVAHMVVELRGNVRLELQDTAIVTPLGNSETIQDLDVGTILASTFMEEENLLAFRTRAVTQMLVERSILDDEVTDRVLIGARGLLCKYAVGQNLWMEVALKAAAVALVSASSSSGSYALHSAIAFALGMAMVTVMVSPYAHPQLNDLQSLSYLSLAVAAMGFHLTNAWISRAALAAPFLLFLLQVARPDSIEARALRLHEELKAKAVEVMDVDLAK